MSDILIALNPYGVPRWEVYRRPDGGKAPEMLATFTMGTLQRRAMLCCAHFFAVNLMVNVTVQCDEFYRGKLNLIGPAVVGDHYAGWVFQ